ncbi:hypothetical protein ABEV15_01240 [Bhargavaea massiliensis]
MENRQFSYICPHVTVDLPKLDEPTLTIYSQATNAQKAKEYTKYYIKKIRQYQNV